MNWLTSWAPEARRTDIPPSRRTATGGRSDLDGTTRSVRMDRRTSGDQVASHIRRLIFDGKLRQGDHVRQDDIAADLGVSRIPVREALKTLVAEGLVSQRPRSDYTVARLTRGELLEFYTVRGVLELATLVPALNQADATDDLAVQQAHGALAEAVRVGDIRGHHRESRRFHFAMLAPSQMFRMLHMLEAAWNMTEPIQPMAHAGPRTGQILHHDHDLMLAAFLARDMTALIGATRDHNDHLSELIAGLPVGAGLFLDEY